MEYKQKPLEDMNMSDLAATNCGCGCETRNNGGCGNIIWIILLLSCCGGWGNNNSCGCGGWGNDSCIWIILLLFCCGGWGNNGGGFCC